MGTQAQELSAFFLLMLACLFASPATAQYQQLRPEVQHQLFDENETIWSEVLGATDATFPLTTADGCLPSQLLLLADPETNEDGLLPVSETTSEEGVLLSFLHGATVTTQLNAGSGTFLLLYSLVTAPVATLQQMPSCFVDGTVQGTIGTIRLGMLNDNPHDVGVGVGNTILLLVSIQSTIENVGPSLSRLNRLGLQKLQPWLDDAAIIGKWTVHSGGRFSGVAALQPSLVGAIPVSGIATATSTVAQGLTGGLSGITLGNVLHMSGRNGRHHSTRPAPIQRPATNPPDFEADIVPTHHVHRIGNIDFKEIRFRTRRATPVVSPELDERLILGPQRGEVAITRETLNEYSKMLDVDVLEHFTPGQRAVMHHRWEMSWGQFWKSRSVTYSGVVRAVYRTSDGSYRIVFEEMSSTITTLGERVRFWQASRGISFLQNVDDRFVYYGDIFLEPLN